ncbi:MAG: hypothetical protein ACI4GW_11950 [Lachnospiraceae bacterium]
MGIKRKIMDRFFQKEISKEIYNAKSEVYAKVHGEIAELKKQNNELEKINRHLEIIYNIFEKYQDAKIIGIEKNLEGEEFFVVLQVKMETILLINEFNLNCASLLYYEIYQGDTKKIELVDLLPRRVNLHEGEILVSALINYGKEINATKIFGKLSPVDNDHKDRRNHFYEKMGFTINGSKIEMELN